MTTWINKKYPNQDTKNKIKDLTIDARYDKLEGELDVSDFVNLESFRIDGDNSRYHKLDSLKLVNCSKLNDFFLYRNDGQISIGGNSGPNNFYVQNCPNLITLQFSDKFANTKKLIINNCQSLSTVSNLSWLVNLKELSINNKPQLVTLEGLGALKQLQSFTLTYCSQINKLTGLDKLISLQTLTINNCSNLDWSGHDIPVGITQLNINISYLNFTSFGPPNHRINNSINLTISYCLKFQEVNLENLVGLTNLKITDCPNLERIYGLEDAANPKLLDIQNCPRLTFAHYGEWKKELRELAELILPDSTYNFVNLKKEITRQKINDLKNLLQEKSRELEELVINAKNKLEEGSQEFLEFFEMFLDLRRELMKDINNDFLQKQLGKVKKNLEKRLSEQEINDVTDKHAEVIEMENNLKKLQGQAQN